MDTAALIIQGRDDYIASEPVAGTMPLLADSAAGAEGARLAATRLVRSIRYDWNGRVLPEGDFHRLSDFAEISALEFFDPEGSAGVYYFRGFAGEVYTGSGWAGLPPQRKAEYATLFAWLHERDFYGQSQYAHLRQSLGMPGEAFDIWVENTEASAGYLYEPYEFGGDNADKSQIGGQNLPSGLRGETEYALSIATGSA